MRIYREILRESWDILWRHPLLWVLGLVAAVAGHGGEYSSVLQTIDRIQVQSTLLEALRASLNSGEITEIGRQYAASFAASPIQFVWTIVGMLLLVLGLTYLVTVAQAALIRSIWGVSLGEPLRPAFSLKEGNRHFWPIFILNVLAKFLTLLLTAVAVLPFLIAYLAGSNSDGNIAWLVWISIIIFVPLALIVSFVLKYAATAVVVEELSWWNALTRAINMFFTNWLVSLELSAILFVINLGLSFLVLAFVPTDLYDLLRALMTGFSTGVFLRILPASVLLLLTGAWYSTYQYTAWTLLFTKLQSGPLLPKLVRLTATLPDVFRGMVKK